MMNEMVPVENGAPARRSVTIDMATRFGMDPVAFERTVRSVCMPVKHGDPEPTREEFAAFLLVAREHKLNPITREIYAMRRKGGGLIPVVSVDGWVRLINEHPAFDGVDFDTEHEGERLVSMTCKIYRKDRSHPTVVTEYLCECFRDTEPWKMKHRMLRHKSLIQCGRYAMGFAGIYDPDEAEHFASEQAAVRRSPSPGSPIIEVQSASRYASVHIEQSPRRAPSPQVEQPAAAPAHTPDILYDPEAIRKAFDAKVRAAANTDELNDAWNLIIDPIFDEALEPDKEDWNVMFKARFAELTGGRDP